MAGRGAMATSVLPNHPPVPSPIVITGYLPPPRFAAATTTGRIKKHVCCVGGCLWTWTWQCVQLWTPLSITFVIVWLLFRPDRFRPHVDSAVLADLHVTNSTSTAPSLLHYDLAVNMSFHNPHRRLSFWYLDVEATAFFGNIKLGPADDALPTFLQRPKNTTVLQPAFRDAVAIENSSAVAQQLAQGGDLHMRVRLSSTIMYVKIIFYKDIRLYTYDSWFGFPPLTNASSPAVFIGKGSSYCWR